MFPYSIYKSYNHSFLPLKSFHDSVRWFGPTVPGDGIRCGPADAGEGGLQGRQDGHDAGDVLMGMSWGNLMGIWLDVYIIIMIMIMIMINIYICIYIHMVLFSWEDGKHDTRKAIKTSMNFHIPHSTWISTCTMIWPSIYNWNIPLATLELAIEFRI